MSFFIAEAALHVETRMSVGFPRAGLKFNSAEGVVPKSASPETHPNKISSLAVTANMSGTFCFAAAWPDLVLWCASRYLKVNRRNPRGR
jgi:hypothetical protein